MGKELKMKDLLRKEDLEEIKTKHDGDLWWWLEDEYERFKDDGYLDQFHRFHEQELVSKFLLPDTNFDDYFKALMLYELDKLREQISGLHGLLSRCLIDISTDRGEDRYVFRISDDSDRELDRMHWSDEIRREEEDAKKEYEQSKREYEEWLKTMDDEL